MRKTVLRYMTVSLLLLGSGVGYAQKGKKKVNKNHISPIVVKLRKSYKFIYEGVEDDLRRNQKYLDRYKAKLKKAKESSREKYQDIVKMYEDLISAENVIAGMFDGSSRRANIENAMRKIPDLESRLRLATQKNAEREWLTFDELRKRLKAGMKFRKCPEGVLPYSKDIWYKPKESKKDK